MKFNSIKHVALLYLLYLTSIFCQDEIKMTSIDPSEIKVESIDLKNSGIRRENTGFDISSLKNVIIKVHFREKYMKKKGILDLTSEVEEGLQEEEIQYANLNMKEEKYIWIMCNDAGERQRIKDYLAQREYTLVVELEGKRFFGKFSSQGEKTIWKENNKIDESKKNKFEL